MRLILLLLTLLSMNTLYAARLKPISILQNNQKIIFPINNYISENSLVYVYGKNTQNKFILNSVLKVTMCDVDSCEAKVSKIRKGVTLNLENFYSSDELSLKPKTPKQKDLLYGSYGGPMAYGFDAGYLQTLDEDFRLGATGGTIDADIGNVGYTGQYAAAMAEYRYSDDGDWKFNPYAQIGYLMTTLDFSNVDGSKIKANAPFVGVGMHFRYETEDWFAIAKGGYSYNMYKSSYSDSNGSYTSPISGGLVVFEAGIGFKF